MSMDDLNINVQILERCKNGEVKAQFLLYKQYSKAMYNIAIRFLNNKMDAEDILQESFVTAFEKLGELSSHNALGSWLSP
jgi:RNA polymerase sigma-70 factor (ECF subfamily)